MKRNAKIAVTLTCAATLVTGAVIGSHASGLLDFLNRGKNEEVTISVEEYERLKQFEKLATVKEYIETYYYQDVDTDLMMEYAMQGMLSSLDDPYTFY